MTVLFHYHLAREFPDVITSFRDRIADKTVNLVVAESIEGLKQQLPGTGILVSAPVDEDTLALAPQLRLHVVPFAGVNRCPLEYYKNHDIVLANSHGNASAVAQRAVALLYAASGRVVEFDRDLRSGWWHRRADQVRPFDYWRDLAGSRIAVLGVGAVGTEVGRLLRPLAGELVGYRRNSHKTVEPFDRITRSLEDTVSGADAVIVALPSTPETIGALTADHLSRTNQSVLINVGRADIVPEDSLFRCLTNGTLYAAGLDVWYRNPHPHWADRMPGAYPWHTLSNVVLSPHAASHSEAGKRGQLSGAISVVEEFLTTGGVRAAIDTTAGY